MRVDLHSRVHDLLRPNQTSTPTPPRPSGTLLPANLLRRTTFTLAFVYLCGSLSESTGCATAVRRAFWERGGFFRALELSLRQCAETDPEDELRRVVVVVVVVLLNRPLCLSAISCRLCRDGPGWVLEGFVSLTFDSGLFLPVPQCKPTCGLVLAPHMHALQQRVRQLPQGDQVQVSR